MPAAREIDGGEARLRESALDVGRLLLNDVLSDPYVDVVLVGMRVPRFVDLNNEISDDVASRIDLADEASQQARIGELKKMMDEWFARYVDPVREGRVICSLCGPAARQSASEDGTIQEQTELVRLE